jgi:hypothetical protein
MRSNLLLTAALALGLTATPVRADGESEARALVDKAIKAHGGADNLTKFKAAVLKMKGKVQVGGMAIEFASTASIQDPDKMKVETDIDFMGNKLSFVQVLDDDKGWIKFADKVMDMDKDQVAEMVEQLHARRVASLAPLGDRSFKLSLMGESKINGKDAVGVQVSCKDRRDVSLFFDKQSGLIVKTETRSRDIFGGNDQEFTAETYFAEYKDFGGVKRPTKQTLKRDGKDFGEVEISEYDPKDKLDNSVFAKP